MNWTKKLEDVSLAQITACCSAFIYVTGYLITSLYIRSRGINEMSLLSAQYIETGLIFALLTALFIVVPVIILRMAMQSRHAHGYPNIPLSLVFPIVTSNYLYVFTFFCLFVTRYEWLLRFRFCGYETGLIQCFASYTAILFILQVAFIYLKYSGKNKCSEQQTENEQPNHVPVFTTHTQRAAATIIILASLAVTIIFDWILFTKVGWFPEFMSRAVAYLFCIVLIVCVVFVVARMSRVYPDRTKRWQFWFVAGPLLLALYYFAISSYEFGVYINIPMSRGGKYPITQTTLYFKPDTVHSRAGRSNLTAYVIEETEHYYYVIPTEVSNWFQEHPPVEGINKDDVAYPHYDHLKSGEPRINHLKKQTSDGFAMPATRTSGTIPQKPVKQNRR